MLYVVGTVCAIAGLNGAFDLHRSRGSRAASAVLLVFGILTLLVATNL